MSKVLRLGEGCMAVFLLSLSFADEIGFDICIAFDAAGKLPRYGLMRLRFPGVHEDGPCSSTHTDGGSISDPFAISPGLVLANGRP